MKSCLSAVIFVSLLLTGCGLNSIDLESDLLDDFRQTGFTKLETHSVFSYQKDEKLIKIIKIDGIAEESAREFIAKDIQEIKIIYSDGLSPYPGEISNKISVNKDLLPIFKKGQKNGQDYAYILLYTNERFTLGIQSADSIKYRYLIGWLYCIKKSIFYKINIYFPHDSNINDIVNTFLSMRCK